jgi:hypothetical protein
VTGYRTVLFKGGVVIAWLLSFFLMFQRDYFIEPLVPQEALALARDAATEFQGIYFKNSKIGYVQTTYLPGEGSVRIEQQAVMHLTISGETQPIDLSLSAVLAADNTLQSFNFNFSSLFYQMNAEGVVENNRVSFTLDTGSSTISDHLDLKTAPMLSTSRRRYLLRDGVAAGDKVSIPWFDPVSLSAKNSTIEYRGKEKILIHGRVHHLHRFIEYFSGARINSWLDDEGTVVKEESPAGFVFIQEPEFKAKIFTTAGTELLSAVAVKPSAEMPANLAGQKIMRYRLKLPEDSEFDLNSGRQSFSQDVLTIEQETFAAPADGSNSSCPTTGEELAASPYIQSDAADIISRSKAITSGLHSAREKAEALAAWVNSELQKRPVVGIPDALTTLKNRVGDCNEHAALYAALARAAGIPTKIAAGVVFHKGAFYYHAWNEVCLSGRWLSLDTTTGQFPTDLSHIKFVEGELKEQMRISSLLGILEIEPLGTGNKTDR